MRNQVLKQGIEQFLVRATRGPTHTEAPNPGGRGINRLCQKKADERVPIEDTKRRIVTQQHWQLLRSEALIDIVRSSQQVLDQRNIPIGHDPYLTSRHLFLSCA